MVAYFHGGGWAVGSIDSFDAVCRALANESGAIVASVGYRLAPEHPFPTPLEECVAATRALAERHEGEPVAVAGDSSGGNLAIGVARRLRDQIRAQALIYPVCDAGLNTPSYRDCKERYGLPSSAGWDAALLEPLPRRRGRLSARRLAAARGRPRGPAAHVRVLTSEFDVLRDEGEALAENLREAGVDVTHRRYEGTIHGFCVAGWRRRTSRAARSPRSGAARYALRASG